MKYEEFMKRRDREIRAHEKAGVRQRVLLAIFWALCFAYIALAPYLN